MGNGEGEKVDPRILDLVKNHALVRADMKGAVDAYKYDESGNVDEAAILAHIEKGVDGFRALIAFALGQKLDARQGSSEKDRAVEDLTTLNNGGSLYEQGKNPERDALVDEAIDYCHEIIQKAIEYNIAHFASNPAVMTVGPFIGVEKHGDI
jgi:hypothetical protein